MSISNSLRGILDTAARSLAEHPQGHLILPQRRQIWAALGPLLRQGNRALPSVGHSRRGTLAILCARKVATFWHEALPDDQGFEEMLTLAKDTLAGSALPEKVKKRKDRFWTYLDNLISRDAELRAIYAGAAAEKSVSAALIDEVFDPVKPDDPTKDEDLDAYQWDASLYASAAFADGFTWDEGSSLSQRREFWQWYLETAVLQAWSAFPGVS